MEGMWGRKVKPQRNGRADQVNSDARREVEMLLGLPSIPTIITDLE